MHPTSRGTRLSLLCPRMLPELRGMRDDAQGGESQPQPVAAESWPFHARLLTPRRGSPQKDVKLAFQHNAQALNTNFVKRG